MSDGEKDQFEAVSSLEGVGERAGEGREREGLRRVTKSGRDGQRKL